MAHVDKGFKKGQYQKMFCPKCYIETEVKTNYTWMAHACPDYRNCDGLLQLIENHPRYKVPNELRRSGSNYDDGDAFGAGCACGMAIFLLLLSAFVAGHYLWH